jgi:N-acetylglucosaminyldiphosphoundecaprenol N-acetyl-beta-D-mannosaminyltransferase
MQKINIRDVHFCNVTLNQAIDIVVSFLQEDKNHTVVTPNSEIVQLCLENDALRRTINGADLVIPDGIGVIYAAKILKRPLIQRVTGIDLATGLLPKIKQGDTACFVRWAPRYSRGGQKQDRRKISGYRMRNP